MNYRLHQPECLPDSPRPLLVVLHGCTQNPADIAAGTRFDEWADRCGWLVLYPEQATASNPKACWNWFHRGHQHKDSGEPAELAALTRTIADSHSVDRQRIFLAGMSAGAAMAAWLALHFPGLYRGLAAHSGLPPGAARNAVSALLAMRALTRPPKGATILLPTIVFHGKQDGVVNFRNGERLLDRVDKRETQPEYYHQQQFTRTVYPGRAELWLVHELGHAWSGGSPKGSYTDPRGPDASAEIVRFFTQISSTDG